ncbi:MAG: hypothetical protein RRY38_03440, partial [Oscillospiraceae bacterium]
MKKILAAAVSISLCLCFAACAGVDASYQSAIEQSSAVTAAKPKPEPKPEVKPDQPPTGKPELKPETPVIETVVPAAEWPSGVPAITSFKTRISEQWENGDSFNAQYLVSKAQLATWESDIKSAGFASNPSSNGMWTVSWQKFQQTGTEGADYRVAVGVKRIVGPTWPAAYEEFPPFNGEGAFTTSPSSTAGGNLMALTSANETQAGLKKYVDTLLAHGFSEIEKGVYDKTVNGVKFTVDTRGAWVDTSTLRINFEIRGST